MSEVTNIKQRHSFHKDPFGTTYPDLLAFQYRGCKSLFQPGRFLASDKEKSELYKIFAAHFPIISTKEHFKIEFLGYTMAEPIYTPEECVDRGLTYESTVTIRLRLTCKEDGAEEVTEEEVFFAELPCMTNRGSFVFKGIERVIISQLLRAPGLFFSKAKHVNGLDLYTAKLIPASGSWIEIYLDTQNVMYVYLDRRRKVPATLFLRAMGYGTDKDILQLFDLTETVKATKPVLSKHKGRTIGGRILKTWVEEFVDEETGEVIPVNRHEVIVERNTVLADDVIDKICQEKQKEVLLLKEDKQMAGFSFIFQTFKKDETNSAKEARKYIYHQFRNQDPVDEQTTLDFFNEMFFSKRFNLGLLGRYCLNKKLGLKVEPNHHLLDKQDIIEVIRRFPDVMRGEAAPDDPDSLVNRIVKTAGGVVREMFDKGMKLTVNHMRDFLNTRSNEDPKISDVVNSHYMVSAINQSFNLSNCFQYMDQSNPLSEVEHKRRCTKTTLNKERASQQARSNNPTYKNRICPIQTPEGASIGLINHFSVCAHVNDMGFLQASYKKVDNGVVDFKTDCLLTADEEEEVIVAHYTQEVSPSGKIGEEKLHINDPKGDIKIVGSDKVNYMAQAGDQLLSMAGTLIPFIENTESGRATMGCNMQRQAVALIRPESPIVGTGQEKRVAQDSRVMPMAKEDGEVIYVDAEKIVVKKDIPKALQGLSVGPITRTYPLFRLRPTNQKTCIHQTPIVKKGDLVKKGDFLADGYGVSKGELATGKNPRVAMMSWRGNNYEDGFVFSDALLKNDMFTSQRVEKIVCNAYDTKLGPEEFTRDIPGVNERALRNLDENGVVRIGTKIKENDILVGKITPQNNDNPSPESKLMAAIFGNNAENVKNTSLKATFGNEGIVIGVKILEGAKKTAAERKQAREAVKALSKKAVGEFDELRKKACEILGKLLKKEKLVTVYDVTGNVVFKANTTLSKEVIEEKIFSSTNSKEFWNTPYKESFANYNWTSNDATNEKIAYVVQDYAACYNQLIRQTRREMREIQVGEALPAGIHRQVQLWICKTQKLAVGDKIAGLFGNKGVISNIVPESDMPFDEQGRRIQVCINPLSIPSRMNVGQVFALLLGEAGQKLGRRYTIPSFSGCTMEEINNELKKAGVPPFSRIKLYDGLTGEPFDQPVTCGVMYLMKLNHLVQDKIHVRGNGPRSLMDEQPTQGKKYKGGQRVGGMERNALEGYGAAGILNELFTIKSDDLRGSQEMQDAIYKGRPISSSYIPESLRMLEQFCAGLCLSLEFRSK